MTKPEPQTVSQPESQPARERTAVLEGRDYYLENGFYVFTAEYLRNRGYCCGNDCRHCPYDEPTK